MGKRSNFERRERDFYRTPRTATLPLLLHVPQGTPYAEPCAGDGYLVEHLNEGGLIGTWLTDIEPQDRWVGKLDVFDIKEAPPGAKMFITNPPWDRSILHPLIVHLSDMLPTWLLFDADWAHTKQSSELIKRCRKIVSVGRVKWIEGSKFTGKDNCAWYLFDGAENASAAFHGRT